MTKGGLFKSKPSGHRRIDVDTIRTAVDLLAALAYFRDFRMGGVRIGPLGCASNDCFCCSQYAFLRSPAPTLLYSFPCKTRFSGARHIKGTPPPRPTNVVLSGKKSSTQWLFLGLVLQGRKGVPLKWKGSMQRSGSFFLRPRRRLSSRRLRTVNILFTKNCEHGKQKLSVESDSVPLFEKKTCG